MLSSLKFLHEKIVTEIPKRMFMESKICLKKLSIKCQSNRKSKKFGHEICLDHSLVFIVVIGPFHGGNRYGDCIQKKKKMKPASWYKKRLAASQPATLRGGWLAACINDTEIPPQFSSSGKIILKYVKYIQTSHIIDTIKKEKI